MKNQALFSSKDRSKKLKCRLLQFLFGALRVNTCICILYDLYYMMLHRISPITDCVKALSRKLFLRQSLTLNWRH